MGWTLDELVGRVAQALAAADVRAPNGRVTQVPDARMIRWYITTGLVDRPLAMRGRVGLYGPRHLLQLVAIKRRQSEGRSLAEIQVELAGATDAALTAAARVPLPALADTATANDTGGSAVTSAPVGAPRRDRFWAQRPALAPVPAELAVPDGAPTPAEAGAYGPTPAEAGAYGPAPAPVPGSGSSTLLHGVTLDGAVLLLAGQPGPADLVAIRAAAQPLLDLLAARGLLIAAVKGAQG